MKKSKTNWFKKQMLALSISLSNVEKQTLHIKGEEIGGDIGTTQRVGIGTLADDLIQGKLTEQVKLLRSSMYSALAAADKMRLTGLLTDKKLGKVVRIGSEIGDDMYGEPSDDYKVEMIVDNTPSSKSFVDSMDDIETKPDYPIIIGRSITPRFRFEEYVKKLYIKNFKGKTKIFEFYVSKYPDIFNKHSTLFLNSLKKAIANPRVSDILDIENVGFITNNTTGADSFLEFQYDVLEYYKTVEFSEYYVIKFKAKVTLDGEHIFEKFNNEDLNKEYENKERRKGKRSDTFNG